MPFPTFNSSARGITGQRPRVRLPEAASGPACEVPRPMVEGVVDEVPAPSYHRVGRIVRAAMVDQGQRMPGPTDRQGTAC